ncbi:hypothetical protein SeMB42_g00149 [Synchytrium endobioticum]|uniref:Sodium/calcium exchanger membrane region domain-containing protein n=1 Tax=Synchytrium endobioticum TaxID=286115 RepID=A0A507DUW1_9FUNG|nr:hypothetical protein SeMB42_g00149 [Synchytrium endobioticum]
MRFPRLRGRAPAALHGIHSADAVPLATSNQAHARRSSSSSSGKAANQRLRASTVSSPSSHAEAEAEAETGAGRPLTPWHTSSDNHHWSDDDDDDDEDNDDQDDQDDTSHQLQQAYAFDVQEDDANNDDDDNDGNHDDDEEERTVKDVQEAINIQHPFGLRLWKPALYKKQRSIAAATYLALHADPNASPENRERHLSLGNIAWLLFCGWWMCLVYLTVALMGLAPLALIGSFAKNAVCCCLGPRKSASGIPRAQGWLPYNVCLELEALWDYARVLINLATYVLWPFGQYIAKSRLEHNASGTGNVYLRHDRGERSGLLSAHADHESEPPTPRIATVGHGSRSKRHSRSQPLSPFLNRKSKTRATVSDDAAEYLEEDYLDSEPYSARPLTSGNLWPSSVRDCIIPRSLKRAWASGIKGMVFFAFIILIIAPMHLMVSALCWFCVVSIPMAKLNYVLIKHLLRHPLRLSAHPVSHFGKSSSVAATSSRSDADTSPLFTRTPRSCAQRPTSILFFNRVSETFLNEANEAGEDYDRGFDVVLCTYNAIGLQYYKYTFDGINIILINLLSLVLFALVDFYLIAPRTTPPHSGIGSHSLLFFCALVSVIPLAYMIGMAVSSITAHSGSLALGAVVNATFGSIVEVVLYALALVKGKNKMVEGSIIGSLLCGVLLLPSVSMISGGFKRKERRFNAKAAGVTSAMLIVSLIGVFAPTIFQEIYGTFQLRCRACPGTASTLNAGINEVGGLTCRQCTYSQPHPTLDPVYIFKTRPLMYACAFALVLTYMVGLWFTLRTHSAHIYPTTNKKKERRHQRGKWAQRPVSNHQISSIHNSPQAAAPPPILVSPTAASASGNTGHLNIQTSPSPAPPNKQVWKGGVISRGRRPPISLDIGLQSPPLAPASRLSLINTSNVNGNNPAVTRPPPFPHTSPAATTSAPIIVRPDPPILLDELSSAYDSDDSDEDHAGGHDAPNWSQLKSCTVLLTATVAFSLIADVLIDSVDVVLKDFDIDEKFLGLTLFSLVPSVTEFYVETCAFTIDREGKLQTPSWSLSARYINSFKQKTAILVVWVCR